MKLRWQDWGCILLGAWLLVSPWQMGYTLSHAAFTNAGGLGAALVVFNLMSVWRLLDEGQEIVNILLGTWLVCSPYALSFVAEKNPAINAIAVGTLVIVLAVWQIYDATRNGKK
jgi:hypothetical protein